MTDAQDETVEELSVDDPRVQQLLAGQAKVLLGMLIGFVPDSMKRATEIVSKIAFECTQAQFTAMGEMLSDAIVPERRAAVPFWGVYLRYKGADVQIIAPKQIEDCQSEQELIAFLVVLGLVAAPLARAALAVNKIDVRFIQAKSWPQRPPPPRKLHIVGG